jgi:hypothetical protein
MAIHISTSGTKKKAPKAKAGVQAPKTLTPEEQLIEAVGEATFDEMIDLQIQIDKMKPTMDKLEKLRGEVDKAAMKIMDKGQKYYFQREHGLVEIPACSNTSYIMNEELAVQRLKEINPDLVKECYVPALGKMKGYLSGPMAEGVFGTTYGKSRKPKVKPGK